MHRLWTSKKTKTPKIQELLRDWWAKPTPQQAPEHMANVAKMMTRALGGKVWERKK